LFLAIGRGDYRVAVAEVVVEGTWKLKLEPVRKSLNNCFWFPSMIRIKEICNSSTNSFPRAIEDIQHNRRGISGLMDGVAILLLSLLFDIFDILQAFL